jgi:hypothetical protein
MTKDKMKVWISVEMSDSLACYIEKQLKEPRKKCFLSLDKETVMIDTIELIEYNIDANIKNGLNLITSVDT